MSLRRRLRSHVLFGCIGLLVCGVTPLSGAIALDNTSQGTITGTSPLSFAHTIGAGSNRLLVVSVSVEDTAGFDVTDVSYNGVSLAQAVEHSVGSTTFMNTEIWYMLEAQLPAPGSYSVQVTTAGASPADINAGVISVTGAAQQPPEATAFADDGESAAGSIQQTITTLTDGAWIFDAVGSGEATSFTPDPGQTQFFDFEGPPAPSTSGGAGSYELKATAGVETQGWTVDAVSNRLAYVLAAFAPASTVSTVYYSVGTSAADLKAGSPTVTISTGTATFSTAQPDNVGVGDEITYNGGTRAYISGRVSSTVYTVTTATGGVPPDIAGATVDFILRAFNSLNEATSGSADASHLNTSDLVAGNIQLNWACYNDGPDTVNAAIQEPWVTGSGNYIRVFTPVGPSEVGTSQRHDGTVGTGYRLAPVASPGVGSYRILDVSPDFGHVRVEGIEIDGSGVTNAESIIGINASDSSGAFQDVRISHNIIHDITNSTVDDTTQSDAWGLRLGDAENTKVWNNIIYDVTNVSTHASSDAKGLEADTGAMTSYVYNNTIYNVLNTGSTGEAVGIKDDANNTIHARNNFVGLVDSASGFEACFAQTFASQSDNVSSDGTAVGATGQTSYATYFESVVAGSEDLHLRSDSFSLWGITGADLDSDPNLPVSDDVDGQARDATAPDIGADELDVDRVYYSVGISTADLKNGTPTMTMTTGVATFTTAQPANVGLGDEVSYNGGTLAYISERMSSTVYRLTTATGTTPPDEVAATVDSITRAFNSLAAANIGSKDASHLNATDLTTAKVQLNWVFYDDGPLDEADVDIDGWTTGPDHFIRLFTPTEASEVGVSQRHTGVAGTGFRFAPVDASPPLSYQIVTFHEEYVRVEGIEFDGSGITNAHGLRAVRVENTVSPTSDLRFESLLVHDFENSASVNADRDVFAFFVRGGSTKLSNSIFYDFALLNTDAASDVNAIRFEGTGSHFVHNVTVYDVKNLANANTARGIARSSSTVTVRNSAVFDVVSSGGPEECFSGTLTQSNNVSSDGTAAGTGSVTNQTNYSTYFVNVTPSSEDLHLAADSSTLWATVGADLDADPDLPVTDDIDGDARHATAPDIGADETSGAGGVRDVFYSVGTSAADMKSGSPSISISSGTATLSVAQTGNVGVGDEIDYGAGLKAYIHAVTSQSEFEVRTATGTLPPDTGAVTVNSIARTFGTLSGAESASASASYLNTTDLVASNVNLTWVVYDDGALVDSVTVDGYITDATHHITITVPGSAQVASGASQRHDGTAGTGARMTPVSTATHAVFLADPYTTVEWLELDGNTVTVTGSDGVEIDTGGDNAVVQNLLIHHWDESFDDGIWIGVPNVTVRNTILYTNEGSLHLQGDNATVQNVTIYNGAAYGVLVNGTSGHTIENVIAMASVTDFSGPGPVTSNNNLSSDATADDWGGSGHLINQITTDQFVNIAGPIDLHLKAGAGAIDAGTDLSGNFTGDIDGETRPFGIQWDMGADEAMGAPPLDVYYSVGTSVADLKTGAPTVGITAGTASLSVAQTGNIGVGDEIDYGAGLKAYIHAVTSQTVLEVRTATGQVPPDTGAVAVNSIGRTFNSLTDAEASSPTVSYLNTADLVAANVRLTWVVYDDGPLLEELAVSGYNTSATASITLTVAGASQVASGVSQRHTGTAGTGVVLRPQTLGVPGVSLQDPYVRMEWLEVDGTDRAAASDNVLILAVSGGSNADLRNLLVHDTSSGGVGNADGIRVVEDSARIRNSIVYNTDDGLDLDGAGLAVANVTVYGCADEGVQTFGSGTTVTMENVISMANVGNDFQQAAVGQITLSDNNMSSDITADDFGGSGNLINRVATDQFVNIAGPIDLHLRAGADAIDAGKDLSGSFTDDIDGGTRPFGSQWDMGADETSAPSVKIVYYSIGTDATNLMAGSPTVDIASGIATFSEPQPDKVGVGDAVLYGGNTAYISGRTSATVYSVTTATGLLPPNASSVAVTSITRAFNLLSDAQTGSVDVNHLNTGDLVAGNFQLNWACYDDGPMNDRLDLGGWTTGPDNYIRIFTPVNPSEVGVRQRHTGVAGTGFRVAPADATVAAYNIIFLRTEYVRIEGLEIDGTGLTNARSVRGIGLLSGLGNVGDIRIRSNIIHDLHTTESGNDFDGSFGIYAFTDTDNTGPPILVTNNFIYDVTASIPEDNHHIGGIHIGSRTTSEVYNNTVFHIRNTGASPGGATWGIEVSAWPSGSGTATVIAKNNFIGDLSSLNDVERAYETNFNGVLTQSFNVSSDATATGTGSQTGQTSYGTYFNNITDGSEDLHITADSATLWGGSGEDLSSDFTGDIDGGLRQVPWDIGADDLAATTAVALVLFEARPLDGAVELLWETGAEIDNLGFLLYRASSEDGTYGRITSNVIPGLGNSPVGARYSYRDKGLENGTTYFYMLEDIETTGRTELHGPVSTTPSADAAGGPEDGSSEEAARITYGDPARNALRVLRGGRHELTLELVTEGFYAVVGEDGSVELEIPGFDLTRKKDAPALPVKHHWVDALAGRGVEIRSVREILTERVPGLGLPSAETGEVTARSTGTVRMRRRRAPARNRAGGIFPEAGARILEVGFQGESKKALFELAPLRWEGTTKRLVLTRRLVVRISFADVEEGESTVDGVRGRRRRTRERRNPGGPLVHLATKEGGLYGVTYEDLTRRGAGIPSSSLRLSRQGESVPFHLEPDTEHFRSGSTLFFWSEGAEANPYGHEAVFELHLGAEGGARMERVPGAPSGAETTFYWSESAHEVNRFYQPAFLDRSDLWLWETLVAPVTKSYLFEVDDLAGGSGARGKVEVWLQGTSDLPADPDHHVRLYLNGTFLGEESWNGKSERRLAAELGAGVLREGENVLEVENVGDTEAAYSTVMLDRYRVVYGRRLVARDGRLDGEWPESGTASVSGLSSGYVLELEDESSPRWLVGVEASSTSLRFRGKNGRRYAVVSTPAVRTPEIRRIEPGALPGPGHRADYVVIGPRAFVAAARPLLSHREEQGLTSTGVAVEDIFQELGHGEARPEAIRDFLSYAYHEWEAPSLQYVLLLGDASYDFKNYTGRGTANPVPPQLVKTSYLWTVSDPTLAAVNGSDFLPDVAIGRLPVKTVEEVQSMVEKILAYEREGRLHPIRRAVLVADDADGGGDFVADADAAARLFPDESEIERLYLSELGAGATTNGILEAFEKGASLMSYVGHGGIHLWADENIFNRSQVNVLSPQAEQPFLLTMNCLNGYFHFPFFNSLSEELLKAEGRGVIAAFSPSGLSLNEPAQRFHRALLKVLVGGDHGRLGDVVLAAQETYLETGALPELLSIYHLLGDPALVIR